MFIERQKFFAVQVIEASHKVHRHEGVDKAENKRRHLRQSTKRFSYATNVKLIRECAHCEMSQCVRNMPIKFLDRQSKGMPEKKL